MDSIQLSVLSIRFWTCACDNCLKKSLSCLAFFFFFAILAISLDQQANFPVLSVQIIPFLHCSALLTSLSHSLRGHLVLRRHSNFLLRDTNKPFSQEMFWHYFML